MARKKKKNPFWNNDHYYFSKFAVIVTVFFGLMFCFVVRDNVVRWIKAGYEIRSQEKRMRQLQSEIEDMDRQIRLLSHDRDSLEQFARERFHFSEPGDDIYLVKE